MSSNRLGLTSLLLVTFSVGMSVGAQLSLRHGMAAVAEGGGSLVTGAATSPWVLGGLAMYGFGTVSWLLLLSRIDLVVAYPLGSLNFVFVTALSAFLLHEQVPTLRWVGTALILLGIYVVARGEAPDREEVEA